MMYVRCSRCGKRRPSGTKCDCIKRVRKEYDSKYRNKEATQFYHSSDWLNVRNRVMDIYDSIDVFLFVRLSQSLKETCQTRLAEEH